jgi:hypothetical protein
VRLQSTRRQPASLPTSRLEQPANQSAGQQVSQPAGQTASHTSCRCNAVQCQYQPAHSNQPTLSLSLSHSQPWPGTTGCLHAWISMHMEPPMHATHSMNMEQNHAHGNSPCTGSLKPALLGLLHFHRTQHLLPAQAGNTQATHNQQLPARASHHAAPCDHATQLPTAASPAHTAALQCVPLPPQQHNVCCCVHETESPIARAGPRAKRADASPLRTKRDVLVVLLLLAAAHLLTHSMCQHPTRACMHAFLQVCL